MSVRRQFVVLFDPALELMDYLLLAGLIVATPGVVDVLERSPVDGSLLLVLQGRTLVDIATTAKAIDAEASDYCYFAQGDLRLRKALMSVGLRFNEVPEHDPKDFLYRRAS